LNLFSKEIGKLSIEQVMAHLIKVNLGLDGIENSTPAFFERLFLLHSLTGIEWKSQQKSLDQNDNKSVDWKPFLVKLDRVERTITTVENMKAGVLYYPNSITFPSVGIYYKDENENLIFIQANLQAKPVSMYGEFYAAVGIRPENTKVKLFYLTLPRSVNQYSQISNKERKLWKEKEVRIESKWKDSVVFHALLPPDTFESKFPTSQVP
jgi:hypothetical protein